MSAVREDRLVRWLGLALRILPAVVREEHERELRQWIALETRGISSRRGAALLFARVLADTLRAAPRAHWDVLRQDMHIAWRQLVRAPGFAVAAIVTLAVGFAGNAVLFTLADGVLFRPLPFVSPDRLVEISESNPAKGWTWFGISPANYHDLTTDESLFAATAAYQQRSGTVRLGELPDRIRVAAVSPGFFEVFLDRPVQGRGLIAEDEVVDASAMVVSHEFWRTRLGGGALAIGLSVELDGRRFRVVGVMPPGFRFPGSDCWIPLGLPADSWLQQRGARSLDAVGRLREGVTIEAAAAGLLTRSRGLAQAFPAQDEQWVASARGLLDSQVGSARTPLLLVWGAAGLVLLIAIANVGTLLLGRAITRERELALRIALGARAGRLTRQLLTEGLLLAGIGGLVGLGLAGAALGPIRRLGQGAIPRLDEVALGGRVVGYAAALILLAAVVFALLPAVGLRRMRLAAVLTEGRSGGGRTRTRWHAALVTTQVALASFVLVASALVVRTVSRVLAEPLGLDPRGALTFRIEPPWRVNVTDMADSTLARLAVDRSRAAAGYRDLLQRLGAQPGVTAVGAINRLPMTGSWWYTSVDLARRPTTLPQDRPSTFVRVVTPGYFGAIGARLLAGRGLPEGDGAGPRTVVVDQTFARKYFGDASPIGEELLFYTGPPGSPPPRATIVGVVEAAHMSQLDEDSGPTMYLTLGQAVEGHYGNWGMDVVMRGAEPSLEPAIKSIVREVFPEAAVFRVRPLEEVVSLSLAPRRFQLFVLTLFGAVALTLTMVGVGALLLLAVRRQHREIGVRLALGQRPGSVYWLVQRRGAGVVCTGTLIGLGVALVVARSFSSLVYGVSVRDPVAFFAAPLILAGGALAAGMVPALRAMRLDPSRVLREE